MGDFIYFTENQKERANAVQIADILHREGEQLIRSGNEWRWKRHDSVTIRGNSWYRHSERKGSHAIDFMQEFYGMSFPDAVTYLLNGETGQVIHGKNQEKTEPLKEKAEPINRSMKKTKELILPERNDTMKRVYAYLIQQRFIRKDIISYFVQNGILYESKEHHNAVFLGLDKEGKAQHAHKKGTGTNGSSFRINEEGSDPHYGFGHVGKGEKLYIFEAPIDFLSFLTLYPQRWQQNSYIVLNGVAEHAMLQMLKDYLHIKKVILCLDHDAAGIEACGRLAEILLANGYKGIQVLQPEYKDWNEYLKAQNGVEPILAEEHPQIIECHEWIEILKEVCRDVDMKYATKEYLMKYYKGIYDELKNGLAKENLENAFDGDGLLLSGVVVKCIEKYSREMGKQISTDEILNCIGKRYYPHRDKGNIKNRISQLQKVFEETIEIFDKMDLSQNENKELVVRKCMGLTMECVKAHIFVATQMKEQTMERGMDIICSQ